MFTFSRLSSVQALLLGAALMSGDEAAADFVIPDDLIVQGSTCVGLDCVDGESFDFDTIKLKENNLRILFQDTSVGAFPTNDWRLIANDSASGGANFFAIEDATAARQIFKVTAGAPANSIFADSAGRIGLRTATPVLDLHIRTGNTPAHRLEQDSSGGFTAQTWDIGGNEANFFVRDVTGGSRLPFRIRPGAPTSSIDISNGGFVGLGTASPGAKLHVFGAAAADTHLTVGPSQNVGDGLNISYGGASFGVGTSLINAHSASSTTAKLRFATDHITRMIIDNGGNVGIGTLSPSRRLEATVASDTFGMRLTATGSGSTDYSWHSLQTVGNIPFLINPSGGNVGIGTSAPSAQLHTAGSVRFAGVANCSSGIQSNAGGDLSCLASSRQFKHVGGDLAPAVALANVMALRPQVGAYKATPDEPEHWLIAEDVAAIDPALVGRRDGEPYTVKIQGIVADLVAVIQQQQRRIDALERAIAR